MGVEELRAGGDWVLALGPTRAGTLQRGRRRRAGRLGGPVPQRAGDELPHLHRSRRRPRRRGVIGVARTRVLNHKRERWSLTSKAVRTATKRLVLRLANARSRW